MASAFFNFFPYLFQQPQQGYRNNQQVIPTQNRTQPQAQTPTPTPSVTPTTPVVTQLTKEMAQNGATNGNLTPQQKSEAYAKGWLDEFGRIPANNNPALFGQTFGENWAEKTGQANYEANMAQQNVGRSNSYNTPQPVKPGIMDMKNSLNWLFYPDYMKTSTGTKVNNGIGMR